jgi:hypothetical protein
MFTRYCKETILYAEAEQIDHAIKGSRKIA